MGTTGHLPYIFYVELNSIHILNAKNHIVNASFFRSFLCCLTLFFAFAGISYGQCDTQVSGVFTYCNATDNGGPVNGYFVAFRVADHTGCSLNVVDLNGHNLTNRGKRVPTATSDEPNAVSITKLIITGSGADSTEYWYYGPYANGTSFNIALIDPTNVCDTVFVASGVFDCADQTPYTDPGACPPNNGPAHIPLYYFDFSQTTFDLAYEVPLGTNEIFTTMIRPRVSTCCDVGGSNIRCLEMIISLAEDDIGIQIDDNGSGNSAGELFADSLNQFSCTGNSDTTYPFHQAQGASNDVPLCFSGVTARDFIVLSCKQGNNSTNLIVNPISNILVPNVVANVGCDASLHVYNVVNAVWASDDDPGLDNLLSCSVDSLLCTFRYNAAIFGSLQACSDTFTYYIGAYPEANSCLPVDTILYDTASIIVFPFLDVDITQACDNESDSVILTAIVSGTALQCLNGITWSTGDTTTSITVPISNIKYSVTITQQGFIPGFENCSALVDSAIAVGAVALDCNLIVDQTLSCDAPLPSVNLNLIQISGCNNSYLKFAHHTSSGLGCASNPKIVLRYYIVDFDGDTISTTQDRDTCLQRFSFTDISPPSISCPPDVTIQCSASTLPANTGNGTATDNCDTSPTITIVNSSTVEGPCPQFSSFTRTFIATDDCGNSATCTQTITRVDTQAPTLTCPANLTIQCSTSTLPPNTGSATSNDNCDNAPTITFTSVTVSGTCPQAYTITRTWKSIDHCGNFNTCNQIISVVDNIAPAIVCPPNITVAFGSSTPASTGTATAIDGCSTPIVTYTDSVPSINCLDTHFILRQWKAMDPCGNQSVCTQTITILDHGSICGVVLDELDQPIANVPIELWLDLNGNETVDATETIFATTNTAAATGAYCFTNIPSCQFVIVEVQPAEFGDLSDFDETPDPDGNDNSDGADNEIPVTLNFLEVDADNNFIDLICPTLIPALPFDTLCDGQSLTFQISNTNPGISTYVWDFGSGSNPSSGIGLGPHTISYITTTENQMNGVSVMVTVSKNGCPDLSGQVTHLEINAVADASINADLMSICYYTDKVFVPVAPILEGATYLWNFGTGAVPDSLTGYGPHTVYYTSAGTKMVTLIIQPNSQGAQCADTATLSFNITSCPGQILGKVLSTTNAPIQNTTLKLYADADHNGIADNTTVLRTVSSSATGVYVLATLTPGSYVIIETQPTGWNTFDDYDASDDGDLAVNISGDDNLIPLTIMPGELDSMNIFREIAMPGSISGTVFKDADQDEFPDSGEGIAGVVVKLFADSNLNGIADSAIPIDTILTNSIGVYVFSDVSIGNYVLVEINSLHFISSRDFDATNDGDVVPNTNMENDTLPVTVINNEIDANNYFIDEAECPLIVTTTANVGFGSLRYIIECAQSGDTILFDPLLSGQSILITDTQLQINQDLVIRSFLTPTVTISSNTSGLFIIQNAAVEFRDLNIVGGNSTATMAAAFQNYGYLLLHNVQLFRNPMFPTMEYSIRNMEGSQLEISGSVIMH